MKIAVLSHVLPPSWSGQAVMLHRLLKDLPAGTYCLISEQDYDAPDTRAQQGYVGRLPARHFHVPIHRRLFRGERWRVGALLHWFTIRLAIRLRARRIARILRDQKCDAIVACSGGIDLTDLPAACRAARLAGVRFYPYMFDHYAHQWATVRVWAKSLRRYFGHRLERRLVRRADGILVPNEFLRDEFQRLYGVPSTVVHNPLDLREYEQQAAAADQNADAAADADRAPAGGTRIVYTGAVYAAHYDSFRDLLAAIAALGRPGVKLHLYTAQSPAELAEHGVVGPVEFHPHRAVSAVPGLQRAADVLFLPLAFHSPYPELIRTSAPGKMGEYLASGRPILVRSPADSFIAWYCRHYECGLVSDRPDATDLAPALARLLDEPALRQSLASRAAERARLDFDLDKVRALFYAAVGLNPSAVGSGHAGGGHEVTDA